MYIKSYFSLIILFIINLNSQGVLKFIDEKTNVILEPQQVIIIYSNKVNNPRQTYYGSVFLEDIYATAKILDVKKLDLLVFFKNTQYIIKNFLNRVEKNRIILKYRERMVIQSNYHIRINNIGNENYPLKLECYFFDKNRKENFQLLFYRNKESSYLPSIPYWALTKGQCKVLLKLKTKQGEHIEVYKLSDFFNSEVNKEIYFSTKLTFFEYFKGLF